MTQYEFKVVKCRLVDQNYYTSWLAAYGWQVQSMQELVDKVVNESMGFSHTTNSGSMYGRSYYHPHTNTASHYGYQSSHGWGSNMNTTVTHVQTKLSITFFRDINIPDKIALNDLESQWWKCSEKYLAKVIARGNHNGDDQWPELIEMRRLNSTARQVRQRTPIETPKPKAIEKESSPKPQQVENKPVQVPNQPATATINTMEVTHNVFQSGQPGVQIRLNFSLQNRKGLSCGVLAYFRDEHGEGLVDVNNKFKTSNGRVCVGTSCTPDFDDALFKDYILFLPYAELDQPDGERKLQFNVQIYDDSGKTFIAKSESAFFTFFKSGSEMRAECLASATSPAKLPTQPTTSAAKPKSVARMPKPSAPPPVPAAKTPKPGKEERLQNFAKDAGWSEITPDRRLYIEGIFMSTEGKGSAAYKNYKQALEMNPEEERYWSAVSMSLAGQGKLDESITLLEKGLQKLPGNVMLLASLGQRRLNQKNYAEAERLAEEIARSSQPGAEYNALMLRACSAEQQGKYKEAIKIFDQADAKAQGPNPLTGLGQQRCQNALKTRK